MSKISIYDLSIEEDMIEAERMLKTGREVLKVEIINLPHLVIVTSDRQVPRND
jgi:electron transfer flavoprotein alpha/beta subunit